ncbi:hypothetical protein AB4Y43_01480 [Paraburkholderia sp. BR10872]|uniref:hypothetical protein n=1 Tax=Paraburkholderia sp. BR10872 TaxID=3236989 RepID=UPI0034D20422
MKQIQWLDDVEAHDYDAAYSYLNLAFDDEFCAAVVKKLRAAPITRTKAKDIIRMSGDVPLTAKDHAVAHDLEKMDKGTPMSPILLLRGRPVIIADGWHRCCGVLIRDPNAWIPHKIV